jgi:hypothetical protein
VPESTDTRSLLDWYGELVEPVDIDNGVKQSSIMETKTGLRSFAAFLASVEKYRTTSPILRLLDGDREILPAFQKWAIEMGGRPSCKCKVREPGLKCPKCGAEPEGLSKDSARKRITAVVKVCRILCDEGLMQKLPKKPGVRAADKIIVASGRDTRRTRRPKHVKQSEYEAIRQHCSVAVWPNLGMPPGDVWAFIVDFCWTYGVRTEDLVSYTSGKDGLRWSMIVEAQKCPVEELDCPDWQHGWIDYDQDKTYEACLVPMSSRIRSGIESFRGLDPVRVIPMPRNNAYFYREWHRILSAAEVSADISLSGRSVPSFRKGFTKFWNSNGRNLSSVLLGHTSGSEKVSTIDQRHYSNRIPELLDHIEDVPLWPRKAV